LYVPTTGNTAPGKRARIAGEGVAGNGIAEYDEPGTVVDVAVPVDWELAVAVGVGVGVALCVRVALGVGVGVLTRASRVA
jgi:hypothetical protein